MADEPAIDKTRPSAIADDEARMTVFRGWFRADAQHSSKWRKDAKEDFDFVAGRQYTQDELDTLRAQAREPIVFNRTLGIIKAIAGTEINGRHEVRYVPRGNEDTEVNELLTGASKWLSDGCDAEDEESQSFQHTLICGMGWNEARMCYEEDAQGKYIQDAVNPLEMWWDKKARKKNLSDATRIWRLVKMQREDAKQKFPEADEGDLDATWTTGYEQGDEPKSYEEKLKRLENAGDDTDDEVRIVQLQWFEKETYYKVVAEGDPRSIDVTAEQFKTLKTRAAKLKKTIHSAKLTRRVYKQAWLGQKLLEPIEDAPFKTRFSFGCITGEPDHNSGTWYGLVRVARDPQTWSNKWLLQTQYILNSSAKGGIMAELDAFEDQRQAEESWAKQDRITWVKRGAISGANPKIKEKTVAQFPAGYFNMMEFATSSIPSVTGINYELMGQKDVNQPGVLENMRKMAAMTILATMFDSLRRFRKIIGRVRLFVIQNFISDGRLIRITDKPQSVPLMKEKTSGEFDVVVDDAPTSPNQKEQNWMIIASILPAFKEQLAAKPEVLIEILKYSPLPAQLVQAIEQAAAKPNPDAEQAKNLATQKIVSEISKNQATAEKALKDAGKAEATAIYDVALAHKMLTENDGQVGSIKEYTDAAHKLAQTDTERAKAEKLRAEVPKTHAETINTHVDSLAAHAGIGKTQADTAAAHAGVQKTHAETRATHASADATRHEMTAPRPAPARATEPARAPAHDPAVAQHLEALTKHAAAQTAAMQALVKHTTAPKRRVPVRDKSGRITHVDEVAQTEH